MRVALVSSGLIPLPPVKGGAVEEYVYQLTRHLRRLNVDAIAIDARWGGNSVEIEDVNGAEVVRIPVKPPIIGFKKNIVQELLFGKAVVKYIKNQGFDIVHAATAWTGFILALHRSNKMGRFVYTCQNSFWPEDRVHWGEKIVRIIEGNTMRSSDAIIALNKTMYKAIVDKAGVRKNKVVIIPNGVDTDFFKPGLKRDEVLEKYGLEELKYVLFVGRVSPEKGVHILLKAFKHVIGQASRNIKLVVAGPLSSSFTSSEVSLYAKTLMNYAERVLPGKVVFTGPADKGVLRILYSNAYCLVLPSLVEAFGMVIIEAMASGVPVIGSTAGGIPDIVVDGVNGLLFRRGDWRDLAGKLSMLLNDENLRDRLAVNARRFAEERYSWRSVALKLRDCYRVLMHA